jgi:hypothetical protein
MPVELHILKDELHRLNLLFANANMNSSPADQIQKIQEQIDTAHEQIEERNKIAARDLGTN